MLAMKCCQKCNWVFKTTFLFTGPFPTNQGRHSTVLALIRVEGCSGIRPEDISYYVYLLLALSELNPLGRFKEHKGRDSLIDTPLVLQAGDPSSMGFIAFEFLWRFNLTIVTLIKVILRRVDVKHAVGHQISYHKNNNTTPLNEIRADKGTQLLVLNQKNI